MDFTKTVVPMLVVLSVVCAASPAGAAYMDVRMDLNTVQPTPTGWNAINPASVTTTPFILNDFYTAADSGARLDITDAFGDSTVSLTSVSWSNPAAPWVDNLALRDYFYLNSGNTTGRMVISGLDPGSEYRIELLSVRASSSAYDTAYTVNSNYGLVVDGDGTTTSTDTSSFDAYTDGYQSGQFMLWDDVLPDSNGEFAIFVSGGTNVFFNGLRISAVPEPSTLSLLAMGGLAMLGGLGVRSLRRRKRTR